MLSSTLASPYRDLVEVLPESTARRFHIAPMRFQNEQLLVGADSPPDEQAISQMLFFRRTVLRFVRRTDAWIDARINELYGDPPLDDQRSESKSSSCWYRPMFYWWEGRQLMIRCGGWSDENGSPVHWSGAQPLPPEHPDFLMWLWLVHQPQFRRSIEESELPAIRRIFQRLLKKRGPVQFKAV
ncbi:hypothetical protein LOC68_16425 [Blastopirellula sp. JC732]|uniref:Type II secretion system protein GspE N-terminal domain-containing protein n=1 Tax=Blastopirellula sediminis TaxID=2894196 RepID=A0A9X1MNM4_9BACT|nr:hypothetical protein [Blastopirellula sediminis]MCC9606724.1 hypothetical protein [Blastopirellula sediminis]MCC9629979.1 hypothetical protein [Blastopirellula sediminis]